MSISSWIWSRARGSIALAILVLVVVVPNLKAQQSEEFDNYKIKLGAVDLNGGDATSLPETADETPVNDGYTACCSLRR